MKFWIQKSIAFRSLLILALAIGHEMALAQNPEPVEEEEVLERLILRGTPLTNVLSLLEQLTGRSVIRPEQMQTPNITFDSQREITKEEAIIAIESLLSINGIGVSPMGDRFLEVVNIGNIRTESPELVIDSLRDWKPSGKVVSKLFRLQYLDTQTFQQQIQQFLSPAFSSVIQFQNTNAVIVTDTVSNLQRVEYVVQEVDKPSRLNIETRFYTLEFAQASAVAEQMQALIDDARSRFGVQDNRSGNTGGRAAANQRQAQQATPAIPVSVAGAGSSIPEQILFGSTTAITADDRTNQLIIMTEPSNLVFFDEIISKLDIQADPNELIEVIQMDHALAVDVVSLISNFISGASQTEGSDVDLSENLQQNTRGNNIQPNNQRNNRNQTRTAIVENTLEERDSQFSSFMTIVADERSNSIIVSGTRNDLELSREIIEKIDVLLPQVRIEVVIAEVSLSKADARGIDAFGFTYTQNEADGAPNITSATANILGLGISNASFSYDNGTISNLTLDAIFNRAKNNNSIKLISQPNLMTTHNREATITVGERRPLITGSQTDLTGGTAVRSTVSFENIAIVLTVTPLIGPNDVIQMEINQTIEDVSGSVTIDGNEQPIIGTREATSYVSVQDGKLIVLGGLQQYRLDKTDARPALLGDIPVIGKLFGRRVKDLDRTELLVFIKPKVIRTTEEGDADAKENINRLSDPTEIQNYLEEGTFSSDKDMSSNKSESVVGKRARG